MTIENHSDKQSEPRLLGEAEREAVAGGTPLDQATFYALYTLHRWLRLPPPAPDPCHD